MAKAKKEVVEVSLASENPEIPKPSLIKLIVKILSIC